jgi:hypothetical protein
VQKVFWAVAPFYTWQAVHRRLNWKASAPVNLAWLASAMSATLLSVLRILKSHEPGK